jgi:hypothetical protein
MLMTARDRSRELRIARDTYCHHLNLRVFKAPPKQFTFHSQLHHPNSTPLHSTTMAAESKGDDMIVDDGKAEGEEESGPASSVS